MPCIPLHFFSSFSRQQAKFRQKVIQVSFFPCQCVFQPCEAQKKGHVLNRLQFVGHSCWQLNGSFYSYTKKLLQHGLETMHKYTPFKSVGRRYIIHGKVCWCSKIMYDSLVLTLNADLMDYRNLMAFFYWRGRRGSIFCCTFFEKPSASMKCDDFSTFWS